MITKHAEFQMGFIWSAMAIALFIGFAIGAHLTFVIGYSFSLGDGFVSFIQTHGHVQLVGWVGLFIMGISLHFIPRLAGVPIANKKRPRWILSLLVSGLILRSLGQSILPYLAESSTFTLLSWLLVGSGLLEWLGVLLYAVLLVEIFRRGRTQGKHPAVVSVAPFFGMMLSGWLIYATSNFFLILRMVLSKSVVVDQAWNEIAIQSFTGLVLLPIAFAFSVRTFPLYLRLSPPSRYVRAIAWVYLFSLCLQLLPTLPPLLSLAPRLSLMLSQSGGVLKGAAILWFVLELDILTRLKQPWTVNRVLQPSTGRRPTRTGLPDYGEFGRFERLIYSAYLWLTLGALFEVVSGVTLLFGRPVLHSTDAVRHIYLLGFISNLIFGMAVRMMPGFLHRKRIASPQLVEATFWLSNSAAAGRVLPLLLPHTLFFSIPLSMEIAMTVFAFSGIFGIVAVFCLTINLRKTIRTTGGRGFIEKVK